MPGSLFGLRCPARGALHELTTGTSYCWDHRTPWQYEQWVCPGCELLVSRPSPHCCAPADRSCPTCGGELRAWSGRVWHERIPDGHVGAKRVQEPCPRCRTTFSEQDSTGHLGLWD